MYFMVVSLVTLKYAFMSQEIFVERIYCALYDLTVELYRVAQE